MLDEYQRHIAFYNIRFVATPAEGGVVSIDDVIEKLKLYFEGNNAYWVHENQTASVRLIDVNDDYLDRYLLLLVSHSNARIADPSFEHIENGNYRTEPKLHGEGVSTSCHLIIDKKSQQASGFYKAAIEKVPSLGPSTISPFLNSILKGAYENFAPLPTFEFNGSARAYRPLVEIVGDFSETLAEQVQRGRMVGVELIDYRDQPSQLDEEGVFVEKRFSVELAIAGDPDDTVLTRAVNSLSRRVRGEGFDTLKVRMKYEREGSQAIPIQLDLDQEATETLSVRKAVVSVRDALGQRHSQINEGLAAEIIGLLS